MIEELSQAVLLIRKAKNEAELKNALERSVASLGFSTFSFSCNVRDPRDMVMAPMLTNWSADFRKQYLKQKWIEHDVILQNALNSPQGILWSADEMKTPSGRGTDSMQRNFMQFLVEMSMGSGIVVVSRHDGLNTGISLEAPRGIERCPLLLHAASVIANAATIKAETLRIPAYTENGRRDLSTQQVEILKWVAEGKSNTDIAVIIGGSRRAIDYHMGEILRKLGVATRSQAVAVFLGAGR